MNITFEFACQDDCLDKMVPSDLRKLVRERDELAAAVLTALRGTPLDKHGNRDDDGLLPFKDTKTAIEALVSVEALARKVGA